VIRYVASVIGRAGDAPRLAARYGGEEFALIFPAKTLQAALLTAMEEIREEVASRILKRRSTNEDLGAVTVSSGVAERQSGRAPGQPGRTGRRGALRLQAYGGRNRTTAAEPMATEAAA
jgi:diguanylate cyclase